MKARDLTRYNVATVGALPADSQYKVTTEGIPLPTGQNFDDIQSRNLREGCNCRCTLRARTTMNHRTNCPCVISCHCGDKNEFSAEPWEYRSIVGHEPRGCALRDITHYIVEWTKRGVRDFEQTCEEVDGVFEDSGGAWEVLKIVALKF